jgi:energy-coupling factor transport system permease protein
MTLHSFTKITVIMLISFCAIFYQNLYILLGLLVVSVCLVLSKRLINPNSGHVLKHLFKLLPLVAIIFLIQLVFNRDGQTLINLLGFNVTNEGMEIALSVCLRLLILLLSGAWLWGISPRELKSAFKIARLPDSLAIMVFLTLRFIPILSEQIKLSLLQLKTRGIEMSKLSINVKLRLYLSLIIPILGWTLKDLKYHAISLDIRGFRNSRIHSVYRHKGLAILDYAIIGISIMIMVLLFFLSEN